MNNWISVDSKLPSEKGFYNVVIVSDFGEAVHSLWFDDNHWCFDNEFTAGEPIFTSAFFIQVLYWAPLPDFSNI